MHLNALRPADVIINSSIDAAICISLEAYRAQLSCICQ